MPDTTDVTAAAGSPDAAAGPLDTAAGLLDTAAGPTDAVQDSALLRACRREPAPHVPVWFMRQAGRSLPEYKQARGTTTMLEACRTPDLVTEITLQPVRRYGVDAAILYSDIVVPLQSAGVDLDIVPGVGPVIASPVRTAADVEALPELAPEQVEPVAQAVRQLVGELGGTPLIGFAGAPFTLASYLVEGGPSRHHEHTKAMLYGDPGLWNALMEKLARTTATFLEVQVRAGASAVQLFDSWVGSLPATDYVRAVQPHSAAVLAGVAALDVGRQVPRIHFGVGTGELLAHMGQAGADVVGVDFRVPLNQAARRIGPDRAVQGNLDPAALFAPWEALEPLVRQTLESGRLAPGHVFNLGHGVIPDTDPDVLHRVVDLVHEAGRPRRSTDPVAPA